MKRRPTKRSVLIVGIGLLLIIAGGTAQSGWLFVLAAGVLGLVGGSLLVRHPLKEIAVRRTVPSRVRVGDEVRVESIVENRSRRMVPLFTLDDRIAAFDHTRVGVSRLAPGESAQAGSLRVAARRGRFHGGGVTLISGAPFGLMRSRVDLDVASPTIVVPRWVQLRSFPLLEPSSSPSDVVHERPRAGGGEEFLGVRGFRPGDPLRAVHWRTTARAGSLIVKEYEQEMSSRAALVLAGAEHEEGPDSSFEMLVSACASVGLYALSTGHAIHVLTARGDEVDELVDPSSNGLLDWLATVEPTDVALEPLAEEALSRIGRRGTVVLFTTSGGASGSSIGRALTRIERVGARAVLVVAASGSWIGGGPDDVPSTGASVPIRVLENGKELGSCLAA